MANPNLKRKNELIELCLFLEMEFKKRGDAWNKAKNIQHADVKAECMYECSHVIRATRNIYMAQINRLK